MSLRVHGRAFSNFTTSDISCIRDSSYGEYFCSETAKTCFYLWKESMHIHHVQLEEEAKIYYPGIWFLRGKDTNVAQ